MLRQNKGMALYLVLAILLLVTVLANIILNVVINQSTVTQHKVSRMQAFYGARLGITYAIDRLVNNDTAWHNDTNNITAIICGSKYNIDHIGICNNAPNFVEESLPLTISYINVTVIKQGDVPGYPEMHQINATAVYF
jgi:Tfp pilus assembly protein PilX